MLLNLDNASYEEEYEVNGEKFKISVDVANLFRLKFASYLKEGLRIENNKMENNKYTFYISVPEFMRDDEDCLFSSPMDMCSSFKKWISRILLYKHSEEEYLWLKQNDKVSIEVKAKIRKGEYWNNEMGAMQIQAANFSWNMKDKMKNEKYNELIDKMNELNKSTVILEKKMKEYGINNWGELIRIMNSGNEVNDDVSKQLLEDEEFMEIMNNFMGEMQKLCEEYPEFRDEIEGIFGK